MQVKFALPKGQLQSATSALLQAAGLGIADYEAGSRSYRPKCHKFPGLFIKVFQEKDIAIQVAIGNYDLGICGLDWIEELLVKYPSEAVVKLRNLGYGKRSLFAAVSRFSGISSLEELKAGPARLRIVSEYPNLAEYLALKLRLRRFNIFPVWGAAEVYPPEGAEVVVVAEGSADPLFDKELVPLTTILDASAFLIANRNSMEKMDMSGLLSCLNEASAGLQDREPALPEVSKRAAPVSYFGKPTEDSICVALPDGHLQPPTVEFLKTAGLRVEGYSEPAPTHRPSINLDGLIVKVARPQDMPLQVANENFDLAVTGKDWLLNHLYRFPSSPVKEILDLGFGKVRVVAVVSQDLPAADVGELRGLIREGRLPILRVASEYVNIADKYARDNHLAPYRVIPTWGASEAFLPEDADLLIENVQTGATIKKHNLTIIDTLFESSACLIGNLNPPGRPLKEERIGFIIEALRRGAT